MVVDDVLERHLEDALALLDLDRPLVLGLPLSLGRLGRRAAPRAGGSVGLSLGLGLRLGDRLGDG